MQTLIVFNVECVNGFGNLLKPPSVSGVPNICCSVPSLRLFIIHLFLHENRPPKTTKAAMIPVKPIGKASAGFVGFTGSVGTQNTDYIAAMDIAIQTGEDLLLTELLANFSTV